MKNAAYFSAAFKRYYPSEFQSRSREATKGASRRRTQRRSKCGLKNSTPPCPDIPPQKASTAFQAPGNADGTAQVMICMFHRINGPLAAPSSGSYSIFSSSSSLLRPSFLEIRFTWVSTTILGSLYMFPRITLAVLRPTPAGEANFLYGSWHPSSNRSTRSRQQAMIFLVIR